MLKKKKNMTSGEPVMLKSVRRTRSHRMKFCVQKGAWGFPQQAASGSRMAIQRHCLPAFPKKNRKAAGCRIAYALSNLANGQIAFC